MIGLIDFDGTVVYHVHECICEEETDAEAVLKKLVAKGHKLILWTCRNHSADNPYNYYDSKHKYPKVPDSLDEAINWFKERNIPLYAVNQNPSSKQYIGTSEKPLCDFVIDDLNIGTPLKFKKVKCMTYDGHPYEIITHCVDWEVMEEMLRDRGLI